MPTVDLTPTTTITQDISAIETAVYGKDVRTAIADGIRHGYNNAEAARNETLNFSQHLADVVMSQAQPPDNVYNKVWLSPNGRDLVLAEVSDIPVISEDESGLVITK